MTYEYLGILIVCAIAAAIAGGFLLLTSLLGPKQPTAVKQEPFECGQPPITKPGGRFPVKFYLVAMLFILFDIEVVFMFPWSVVYKSMLADPATANVIFFSMLSFIGILIVGYVYALKKRAFDWKS